MGLMVLEVQLALLLLWKTGARAEQNPRFMPETKKKKRKKKRWGLILPFKGTPPI